MTRATHRRAPAPAPRAQLAAVEAPAEPLRSHPVLPPRDYAAQLELIPTACGRLVVRECADGYHRYQLLEPIVGVSTYAETQDRGGRTWGLARTRRPAAPIADVGDQVEHELAEARRAIDVMRRTVAEIALRDHDGRPAGIADALYESRGDVILMTDPAGAARRARDQRGAR